MAIENNTDCFNSHTLLLPLVAELFQIKWVQVVAYFLALLYLFLGIAIIADIFMCAIERITSKTKVVKVRTGSGEDDFEEVEVKIWNDTVANLTLMALGSSAPEILLSIIEIVGAGFQAGDLGPGTIVGSAAFNLLIITGVCIISIPHEESRRIKGIKVFAITSVSGIFAYVWLFIILVIVSPSVVDVWEAALTFLFFPILVFLAWAADKNFFRVPSVSDTKTSMELGTMAVDGIGKKKVHFAKGKVTKKSLAKFVRDLRKVDPALSDEDAACLAATYIFENESHSRLFYRVSACRQMSGSKAPLPHLSEHLQNVYDLWKDRDSRRKKSSPGEDTIDAAVADGKIAKVNGLKTVAAEHADERIAVVQFSSPHAVVLENAGKVTVNLQRFGRMDNTFSVIVQTLDRTAKSGDDYKGIREVVTFEQNQTEKDVDIEIIDDKNWNPDKVFLVRLALPESEDDNSLDRTDVAKGRICLMTVTIVDDDEPGLISFEKRLFPVGEGIGEAVIPVTRDNGADGEIVVSYKTVDGSARDGKDYLGGEGTIVFPHGVTRAEIRIPITNDFEEEHDEYFEVVLVAATNGAKLGKIKRAMVTVSNDDEYNTAMGKLMSKVNLNRDGLKLHREAWLEQYWSAVKVDEESMTGSLTDYILHVLSFGWKVLFAVIPPVGLCGGWVTFFASLTAIGLLTAIVGDVATVFGCLVNLNPSLNAITFVALGTSLPDLFASRTAARMEKYADNAIGNVTGSNSVNVFLGLGLPWLMASVYWHVQGLPFKVEAGSLGFSVGIFTAVALIGHGVLMARRMFPSLGSGELGGPGKFANSSALVFVFLWLIYIALSALNSYGVI